MRRKLKQPSKKFAEVTAYLREREVRDARGRYSEALFQDAALLLNSYQNRPFWLHALAVSNHSEDRRGTDGWAHTDRGDIRIQVKSSWKGAEDHRRRYPNWRGIILIIRNHEVTPYDVACTLLRTLRNIYQDAIYGAAA